MTQQNQVGAKATSIGTDSNGNHYVQYHYTRVVEWNHESIILKANGWRTATTRIRMNQTANQFGLGFQVFQKNFDWFVRYNGETLPFDDGMILKRNTSKIWEPIRG